MKATILIGISGAGKSTYVTEKANENSNLKADFKIVKYQDIKVDKNCNFIVTLAFEHIESYQPHSK